MKWLTCATLSCISYGNLSKFCSVFMLFHSLWFIHFKKDYAWFSWIDEILECRSLTASNYFKFCTIIMKFRSNQFIQHIKSHFNIPKYFNWLKCAKLEDQLFLLTYLCQCFSNFPLFVCACPRVFSIWGKEWGQESGFS